MVYNNEILEWLAKLEIYAKEQKAPMRIMDMIEECKNHVQSEDMGWQELRPMLEQTLESIAPR